MKVLDMVLVSLRNSLDWECSCSCVYAISSVYLFLFKSGVLVHTENKYSELKLVFMHVFAVMCKLNGQNYTWHVYRTHNLNRGLGHLMIETRSRDERFESVIGKCEIKIYRWSINIQIYTEWCSLDEDVPNFGPELWEGVWWISLFETE